MNMRLENISFSELKFLEWTEKDPGKAKNKKGKTKFFGIKRRAKLHLEKLSDSINENGWKFPLIVAELPNKEKWLIDGYGRWEREDPNQNTGGMKIGSTTYPAVIIQADDICQVKDLYFQCHSVYGTPNYSDLISLMSEEEKYGKEKYGYSRYELPGIVHPNFDLSRMTREQIAEEMLKSKYQII